MSKRTHISSMIVDGADYFTAHLVEGGVRIGLVGATCTNIPAGNAHYAAIVALKTEAEVEAYFDEHIATMAGFVYNING